MKELFFKLIPTRIYLELKWLDYKYNRKIPFQETQLLRTKETSTEGSYKPFDDKKAIFVHIPKCAGISVNKALFGNLAGGHTTLEQYLTVFEPKAILNYFKFTIVRNPWDRVVSAYFFLQQGGMNSLDKDFYQKELAQFTSFDSFVKDWLIVPENLKKYHHFKPQVHYIFDKYNKVSVDYIGYLENIDNDFKVICEKLGIDAELPKSNKSNRQNYQDYYTPETRDIVQKAYSRDIEYLGYKY